MSDEFSKSVEASFDAWLAEDSTHWIGDQDAAWQAWMYVHEQVVEPLNAEIAQLKAENEALRKDAERYRWLSKRERWASVGADFGPGGVYRQHRVCWHVGDNWPQVEGHSMGEAIDAAMSKEASHD